MKSQLLLLILQILTPLVVISQTPEQGMHSAGSQDAGRLSLQFGGGKSTTYAVVIGISDYQNEAIPDLRFAHRDAEAFRAYLQSSSGGGLSDDQIILLINEAATTARISGAMDWLIETVQEGDQAIVYFAGHGDVETKTTMQHGFLLTYDSPATTYIAGAYPLFYLQSVISTLSVAKKARVLMITDACHSGKLAGSSIGGAEATSSVLSRQFANEVKIMSCQPNEFSMEGIQWGGGRGVFSYHLIDGLKGLADRDGDFQVKLLEVERYLEDKVSAEAAPNSQIPMSVGNKSQVIAWVDEAQLVSLKEEKQAEIPMMALVDSRGIEGDILEKLDSPTVRLYRLFKQAVQDGVLMSGDIVSGMAGSEERSANDYYRELIEKPELTPLLLSMRRQLSVALQEQAQTAINEYLSIREAQISSNTYSNQEEMLQNEKYARYLNRAAALLGDQHYMYSDITSKEKYFAAKADYHRAIQDLDQRDSLLWSALEKLQAGLQLQENAPHILAEIGKVYSDLGDYQQAIAHCEKATLLSPMWPVPYNLLAIDFFNKGEYEKTIEYAKKALALQPRYENAFSLLVNAYQMLERYEFVVRLCIKMIERHPDYLAAYLELGLAYNSLERYSEADAVLQKALTLAPETSLVYAYLGDIYLAQKEYKRAERTLLKAIELDPYDNYPYVGLGLLYLQQGKLEEAEKTYLATLGFYPDDYVSLGQLGMIYLQKKEYEMARTYFEKEKSLTQDDPINLFHLFCFCYETDQTEQAFDWLEKAFEQGLSHFLQFDEIEMTSCFQKVKKNKRYRKMERLYRHQ